LYKFLILLVVFLAASLPAGAACDSADEAVKKGNYKQAVNYYRMCASREDAASMYKLASLYAKGLGISSPDKKAARIYYLKAADLGYAPAQVMIGADLVLENATSVDKTEGYKWLLLAAEKPDNKWIYPIKDTADSNKAVQYLKQLNSLVSSREKKNAMAAAGLFKQQKIFHMAKLVLNKDEYQEFMIAYGKEGDARAAALAELRQKVAEYKK